MINIITNNEKFNEELLLVLKLFYSNDEIDNLTHTFSVEQIVSGNKIHTHVTSSLDDYVVDRDDCIINKSFPNRYFKRYAKLAFYAYLRHLFPNKILPWGSLTGIRPTKLYYELIVENHGDTNKAMKLFTEDFDVTFEKACLTREIIKNQQGIVKNDCLVDLYINIPFCPSKCYYCSFISAPINKCADLLEPYLDALIYEINKTKKMLKTRAYIVKSIYIGGGTPTILSESQLDRLLSTLGYDVSEFTVECGRPDTITKEKLDVLKKHGVTRISINPQTFCNKTLKEIGRNHTAQDILDAYKLALNYDFDINMDMIAGLGSEKLSTFKKSINKAIEFAPENITVHTLSVKNGSELKEKNANKSEENEVFKMIEYSHKALTDAGYKPYYLYKQKNMIGNLENIGYFKKHTCIFNIDSMEEFASIVACGANAISKRYYSSTNKIERFANLKNIQEYISRIDEMIAKKDSLFK